MENRDLDSSDNQNTTSIETANCEGIKNTIKGWHEQWMRYNTVEPP